MFIKIANNTIPSIQPCIIPIVIAEITISKNMSFLSLFIFSSRSFYIFYEANMTLSELHFQLYWKQTSLSLTQVFVSRFYQIPTLFLSPPS